jgi:hypothetical protein
MIGSNKKQLKIALHGMDGRTTKTMMMFLQGPCKGAASVVVSTHDADVDVFDGDWPGSKNLLKQHFSEEVLKPVIVFSLYDVVQEGAFFVQKPVKASDMVRVLNEAKALISKRLVTVTAIETPAEITPQVAIEPQVATTPQFATIEPQVQETPQPQESEPDVVELKTFVSSDYDEIKKTSKHQSAMQLDEKGFFSYIGSLEDVDVNDPRQFAQAFYDPDDYYQGTVQAAFALCQAKSKIYLLESDWQPITLLPRTRELWLDAGDQELKHFAGMKLKHKKMASKLELKLVDPNKANLGGALYNFQSMDAFLWKLACWTSMGRYPKGFDYTKPVYLKNWPNFTRLLITPHALRITALLTQGPRTMINIAQTLQIKPQYVFVFISAAYAVGLAGQSRRAADMLIEELTKQRSFSEELTKPRSLGGVSLLGRIMNKLRPNKT